MSSVYKRGNARVEANLTPLIDVTFLLIVFFVLVSQIVDVENVPMRLPEPVEPLSVRASDEQRAVINVMPGRHGQILGYRLGNRSYPPGDEGLEGLVTHLTTLFRGNPAVAVNLRADRGTYYEFVEPVLHAITEAAGHVPEVTVAARVNLAVIREE